MKFQVGDRISDMCVFLDKEGNCREQEGVVVKISRNGYHVQMDDYPNVLWLQHDWVQCVNQKYYEDFQDRIRERLG